MPEDCTVKMHSETFFGFITLDIPDCWSCSQKPGEPLGCFEEDRDNGTIWIDYSLLPFSERDLGPNAAEDHVRVVIEETKNKIEAGRDACTLTGSAENCTLSYSIKENDENDGTSLLYYFYYHFITLPGFVLTVHYTLVATVASLNEPECAAISERMLEQIKSPKIDVEAVLKESHV